MSERSHSIEKRARAIAERLAQDVGLEVVEVSWKGSGKKGALRVFIDKTGGIGHDDCVFVSRQMSTILDAEDVVPGGAYHLEVSSPGLDRKLMKPADYERFKGSKVKVKLKVPRDDRQQFTGVLADPTAEGFAVELSPEERVEMRYDEVQTTRLVVEV